MFVNSSQCIDIHNPIPFIKRGDLSQYWSAKETHFLSFPYGFILHNLTNSTKHIFIAHLYIFNIKKKQFNIVNGGLTLVWRVERIRFTMDILSSLSPLDKTADNKSKQQKKHLGCHSSCMCKTQGIWSLLPLLSSIWPIVVLSPDIRNERTNCI